MNNLKDLVLSLIEAKPYAVVTDDEQWVTITRRFTVDPERYVSTSYKPPKKGAPKPPPAAIKAVKPVTAPTKDEAIAQDISSCEATAAECRAANPLYCPYHGTMIIQEDIRQRMVAAGVRGNINVDMDDSEADKETGKGFTVTVTCPRDQADIVKQQLQAFLQTPGISINDASLEGDEPDLRWDATGVGNGSGITMYYDVDTLMADQPPANAAVLQGGQQPQEQTPPAEQGQTQTQTEETPQQTQEEPQQGAQPQAETDPLEQLVSELGEGQREWIQDALDSYRENGTFHPFPPVNAQLERQFKSILGENHPLFGNGQQQGQEGQATETPNDASQETETQPQQGQNAEGHRTHINLFQAGNGMIGILGDEAIRASQVLGVELGNRNDQPYCEFPESEQEAYQSKLIRAGVPFAYGEAPSDYTTPATASTETNQTPPQQPQASEAAARAHREAFEHLNSALEGRDYAITRREGRNDAVAYVMPSEGQDVRSLASELSNATGGHFIVVTDANNNRAIIVANTEHGKDALEAALENGQQTNQTQEEAGASATGALSDDDITDASEALSDEMGELANMDSIAERIRGILQNGVESDSDVAFIDRSIDILGSDHPVAQALHAKTVHSNTEGGNGNGGTQTTPPPASSPSQQPSNEGNLSDADIEDAVSRITQAMPNLPADEIRNELNGLRNGNGISQRMRGYADQAAQLLGEDHPVMRAFREQTRPPAQTQRTQPRPQTPPRQTMTPEQANQGASEQHAVNTSPDLERVVRDNGQVIYNGLISAAERNDWSEVQNMRDGRYEWPVRGNGTISSTQITPELARQVCAHLPFGVRSRYRLNDNFERMMRMLGNPDSAYSQYYTKRIFNKMKASSNPHAKRFIQMFDALHPNYLDNLAERERRQRVESQRTRYAGRVSDFNEHQLQTLQQRDVANDPEAVRLNEGDVTDAANIIAGNLGEEMRGPITTALNGIRARGSVNPSIRSVVNDLLPADHPIAVEINRAENLIEENSRKFEREAKSFLPTFTEDQQKKLAEMASEAGLTMMPNGPTTTAASSGSGYNCYLTALTFSARRMGIDIPYTPSRPCGYGEESQKYFVPVKMAMDAAGWEQVQGRTDAETTANLNRLANEKPDGYTIECWSEGHHGTHAFLYKKHWVYSDVYGHNMYNVVSSEELANHIGAVNMDSLDDEQSRRIRIAARMAIPPAERQAMRQNGTLDEYLNEKVREGKRICEGSFGHAPDQLMTPELLKAMMVTYET